VADLGVHSSSLSLETRGTRAIGTSAARLGPVVSLPECRDPKTTEGESEKLFSLGDLFYLIHFSSLCSSSSLCFVLASFRLYVYIYSLRENPASSPPPPSFHLLKRTEKHPGSSHCVANGHSREGQTRLTFPAHCRARLSDLPNAAAQNVPRSSSGRKREKGRGRNIA